MQHGQALHIVNEIGFPQLESKPAHTVRRPPRGLATAGRPKDEFANFLTHGFGFLLSLAGSYVMMKLALQQQDIWLKAACAVYCISLVSLYAASTLSHAFFDLHRRLFYRRIDQICIFYLIAGSFTPFAVCYLRQGWWPALLISMWVLATVGTVIIWRSGFLTAGAQKVYLLLGWLPAISLPTMFQVAPRELVFWVMLSAFFYTTGTFFLWQDHRMRFFHAMWHTFVIAGSICQYIGILILIVTF